MVMKTSRGEDREVEALAMANCLKLLSRIGSGGRTVNLDGRVFECKICNKRFQSSQALGGHCARHKMPRSKADVKDDHHNKRPRSIPGKPKIHECPICGLDFAVGQALGGHMRRHRAEQMKQGREDLVELESEQENRIQPTVPVLKRSNSKRIFCLDLNLTPFENQVKLGYQIQMSPLLF